MISRIRFTVPKGTNVPPVGTTVQVPVEGGQDWMELGVIEDAHWDTSGRIELTLRLHPGLTNVYVVPS